jgi:phosphatidylglycerol:prolipoprotein diacylglycerol transferase
MHPVLIQFGPVTITSYGVLMALAFLAAVGVASHATTHDLRGRVPLSAAQVPDLACWGLAGGLLGGRLFYVLLHWDVYAEAPWEIFQLWHGGLVWYGGFAGGLLVTALVLRRQRVSFLGAMDQVSPFFFGLAHAIGRIGCWLNGCCLGITHLPIQLIESAGLLFLYIGLRALQHTVALRRPGTVFGVYLIGYGLLRWLVEYGRIGQPMVWAGLTLHQLMSFLLLGIGGYLLFRRQISNHQTSITKHQIITKHQTSITK